jgi:hypothetical protein
MLNKSYKDNITGEIFKVIDIYENIAITDKKNKIDARRLSDERFYSEHIDPKSFFSSDSTYSAFAEKIQSIDLSKVPDDIDDLNEGVKIKMDGMNDNFMPITNDSAVVQYDPEEEKRELMEKYKIKQPVIDVQKQNDAFSKLLDEPESNQQKSQVDPIVHNVNKEVYNDNIRYQETKQEDPIITMFRNVKRKDNFSIDIKIEGLIPRLDFIEMMEDSYEISIIEFLAEEMTNKLLSDPDFIKNKIIEDIKSRIDNKDSSSSLPLVPTKTEEPVKKRRSYKKSTDLEKTILNND